MKVVIIGAGQNGRGFLGRLIFLSGADLSFIDCNQQLIKMLRDSGEYRISFFGEKRVPVHVRNFTALHVDEPDAVCAVAEADLVLVSVLSENLPELAKWLKHALVGVHPRACPSILVCENGIEPANALRGELPEWIPISEAVILCTTCNDGLNIRSQDLDELPYDAKTVQLDKLYGFRPEPNFAVFCRRKIFTYNCLSAGICYPGAEKGYVRFEEAANDPDIYGDLLELRDILDRVISHAYDVSILEQTAFSRAALDKFTNWELCDSIERNARNARRKLGRAERIVGPMYLAMEQGELIDPFVKLLASAICYGVREGSIEGVLVQNLKFDAFLKDECGIDSVKLRERIKKEYNARRGAI